VRNRHDEGRASGYSGRYEYLNGEVNSDLRSDYKRKKSSNSDDEDVSCKIRRSSSQKQYPADGLVNGSGSRLDYSNSGRFGSQLNRNKVEYLGRGEFSEYRDRYSRSSSQIQQGFSDFRGNRSKEREGN